MENTNEMQLIFDSRSSNESFARVTVAAFMTSLNPVSYTHLFFSFVLLWLRLSRILDCSGLRNGCLVRIRLIRRRTGVQHAERHHDGDADLCNLSPVLLITPHQEQPYRP